MIKNRNILIGSLLLLIVAGTILVLSNMKYGVAKSPSKDFSTPQNISCNTTHFCDHLRSVWGEGDFPL